ncbi:MAG: glycosyltransferase family 4 protein [Candidatus Aegiribacteria sp.]|nr:glycosyltransferase family 4 protein [Candidatus Aegiribacteria sp.]
MRIGMEISPLIWEMSGIPNYILRLLNGLASIDSENEYFLYTNRPIPFDMGLPGNFRTVVLNRPSPRFQLWFQLALPLRLKKDRIDLFHGLYYRLPIVLPVPGVLTVHDLSGYLFPRFHTGKAHLVNLMYPVFVKKASRIIAVSEFTAKELKNNFPDASEKITVIHEAPPPDYTPVRDKSILEKVRKRFSLPERFFLFLGTLEPRKNLTGLLDAFYSVADSIPQSLVISGGTGWKTGHIFEKLQKGVSEGKVFLTGHIDRADVQALLSMAEFFVYPSLYEGFGLPVLESMACGTPVITSSVSSMPEIAGKAALLIDPVSKDSIAEAIRMLALDSIRRKEFSEKGLKRAGEFSWRKAAGETMDVYRSLPVRKQE